VVPSSPTIAQNATLDVVLYCVGPPEGGRSNLRHSHAGYPMTGIQHLLLDHNQAIRRMFKRLRSSRCSLSYIPARCHSRSHRQAVTPEQPI
jgi:hypothetical protein